MRRAEGGSSIGAASPVCKGSDSFMSVPSQLLEASAAAADRLDKVLAAAFPDVSRARFQALIAEGAVSVEGKAVTEARHKVKPGDSLRVVLPEAAPALPQAE